MVGIVAADTLRESNGCLHREPFMFSSASAPKKLVADCGAALPERRLRWSAAAAPV